MLQIDITSELDFKTSRSGGSGGQNVNKVETQVEARWSVANSTLITAAQKLILFQKLKNKINITNELIVKSSEHRTQLGNKDRVIKKINAVVNKALIQPKKRKKTAIPVAIKEQIKKKKILNKAKKQSRKKVIIE